MDAREQAYAAEEQRQTNLFAQTIQDAIQAAAKALHAEGSMPIGNALAGALVTVEAGLLASCQDDRSMRTLRAAMDKTRPRALAAAKARGPGKMQSIVIGRKDDA